MERKEGRGGEVEIGDELEMVKMRDLREDLGREGEKEKNGGKGGREEREE